VRMGVSSVEYTTIRNDTIVHMFGIDEHGNFASKKVRNLSPFFYTSPDAHPPRDPHLKRYYEPESWRDLKDNPVTKLVLDRPVDVGKRDKDGSEIGYRRHFATTFEDDVLFPQRALVELDMQCPALELPDKEELYYRADLIEPVSEFDRPFRRIHLDIEVSTRESRGRFPKWSNPINPIYSIANFFTVDSRFNIFIWHPSYSNRQRYSTRFEVPDGRFSDFPSDYPLYIWTFDNEVDMLNYWVRYVVDKRPNIITGYNSLRFDFPYLFSRMDKLKVRYRSISPLGSVYVRDNGSVIVKGVVLFDTYRGFKKLLVQERRSNSLDNVSYDKFGVGKVKHLGIDWMWDNDRDRLIRYNVQDVFLEYAVGEIDDIYDFFRDVSAYAGCKFEDVLYNSRVVDALFLHAAKKAKIVLPSKRGRDYKKFQGADVIQPPGFGVVERVLVLDLKSLYPMIMITLNMGEDTIVVNPSEEEIPNLIKTPVKGVYFRKDKPSFVAGILKGLIDYRDEIKSNIDRYKDIGDDRLVELYNRVQTIVKYITNTIWGVIGNKDFRLYNLLIASTITATERLVINYTIEVLRRNGYNTHYGDTDSVFVLLKGRTKEEMEQEAAHLNKIINDSYDAFLKMFNVDKHYFLMLPEKIYATMLMTRKKDSDRAAKKRYAGLKLCEFNPRKNRWIWFDKPKVDIKGYDRSDMSALGNTVMKRVQEMAIYRVPNEKIVTYLRGIVAGIKHNKYPLEDVGFHKGIKRPLETYKGQDWIRAARWTNRWSSLWGAQTNYGEDTKPAFVYIKKDRVPAPYDDIEIIALDESGYIPDHLKEILDHEKIIERTIKGPVETTLEAIGIKWTTEVAPRGRVKVGVL